MLAKWFSRLYHAIVFIIFLALFIHVFTPILVEASPITNVFINEIHYDNNGTDEDEFIELAGLAGVNLQGWSLSLYNGSSGGEYGAVYTFSNLLLADTIDGFGFASVYLSGIQNGMSDGIVLADAQQNIIQFLSYEGTLTANSGIAKGLTSIDIGVNESNATPLGYSLQLTGQGSEYQDFTWSNAQLNTFSSANVAQRFIAPISTGSLGTPPVAVTPVNEPQGLALILLMAFLVVAWRNKPIFSH